MLTVWPWLLVLSSLSGSMVPGPNGTFAGPQIAHWELRDDQGHVRHLSDWQDRQLVVVAFLAVDCPLCKLYGPRLEELAREFQSRGVAFIGIDANRSDSLAAIGRYALEHHLSFPVLKDAGNHLADQLGGHHTPEVFVLDARRVVRYQGRIDDQYGVNGRRPHPEQNDLRRALEELLAGQPVSVPATQATGCAIERLDLSASGTVTYNRDVAPILQNHCVVCHRPGQIAPFALTSYRETARKARTIREAVEAERMPPWHADPRYGKFANDGRLTDEEKQCLYDWIDGGLAEGKPADLPPARQFTEGWNIPQPDVVISMPQPFTVPAQGVLDYQWFEVDPGFKEDTWIQAAEIRPGNRKVVHHANVFLRAPGTDGVTLEGELGNYFLAGTAPGTPPLILPPGMAKLVPAGFHLVFVVHYSTIGTEQTDQTSIGLVFADPKTVKKEVATNLLFDEDLAIPPRTPDFRVERTQTFPKDVLLLAMFPHMHLRGKSFRYEAVYPDGSKEILLDVPRYDFNWQNRYVLAEPKRLPAGTTLRCIAHYDNSEGNPNNPDPNVTVHAGRQSWDEMFNGYVEIALADQDLTQPKPWHVAMRAWVQKALQPRMAIGPLLLGGVLLVGLRFVGKKRRQTAA